MTRNRCSHVTPSSYVDIYSRLLTPPSNIVELIRNSKYWWDMRLFLFLSFCWVELWGCVGVVGEEAWREARKQKQTHIGVAHERTVNLSGLVRIWCKWTCSWWKTNWPSSTKLSTFTFPMHQHLVLNDMSMRVKHRDHHHDVKSRFISNGHVLHDSVQNARCRVQNARHMLWQWLLN